MHLSQIFIQVNLVAICNPSAVDAMIPKAESSGSTELSEMSFLPTDDVVQLHDQYARVLAAHQHEIAQLKAENAKLRSSEHVDENLPSQNMGCGPSIFSTVAPALTPLDLSSTATESEGSLSERSYEFHDDRQHHDALQDVDWAALMSRDSNTAIGDDCQSFTEQGTQIELDAHGCVWARGNNIGGRCGIGSHDPFIAQPTKLDLPFVDQLWHGHGSWFARTATHLLAWGCNNGGKLGIMSSADCVIAPAVVRMAHPVTTVMAFDLVTFIHGGNQWFGCGWNVKGSLGQGHLQRTIITPIRIPNSEHVTMWYSQYKSTFAWSPMGMLACGDNSSGQLGVGRKAERISALHRVVLPDGVWSIDNIKSKGFSTFFRVGDRCFVAGLNRDFQLGLSSNRKKVCFPVELSYRLIKGLDDVITYGRSTVISRSGQLLVCGNNKCEHLSLDVPVHPVPTPTPLALPWAIKSVTVGHYNVFVQRYDGAWYAMGNNDYGQLGGGHTRGRATTWERVQLDGIQSVVMGEEAILYVTNNGLYTAGWNQNGDLLGVQSTDESITIPQPIVGRSGMVLYNLPTIKV